MVKIANFKTYLKNVFVALSRNAPKVCTQIKKRPNLLKSILNNDQESKDEVECPASSLRCNQCMSLVGRGKRHFCCFSVLVLNFVSMITAFGLHCTKRVCAELLKWVLEQEGHERGKSLLLSTGIVSNDMECKSSCMNEHAILQLNVY